MPARKTAFTLIELLVVISIIALLIAILLPALGAARQSAQKLKSNTQLRGIQQGLFIYANDNHGLFPGLRKLNYNSLAESAVNMSDINTYKDGFQVAGSHVGGRYAICLEADLFSPAYLVSPLEITSAVQEWDRDNTYKQSDVFYSYALPRIQRGSSGTGELSSGRGYEWQSQANSQAVAVTDRLYRSVGVNNQDPDTHTSLASEDGWVGGVSFNDNHVESYNTSRIDAVLSYRNIRTDGPDNLFDELKVGNQKTPSGAGESVQYNAYQIIRGEAGVMLPASIEPGSN